MLDKNRADNYKYVVEKLISDVMEKDFNPEHWKWILGEKVISTLIVERYEHIDATTLYGVEITKGEGEEIRLVRKDYVV